MTRLTRLVPAPTGELFVIGWTQGSIDAAGPYGSTDALVVKLASDRSTVWARQVGQSGGVWPGIEVKSWDAALTASGELVIAGLVNGRGVFRGQTLTATFTAFVAKLSSSGDEIWMRLLGGTDGATEVMGVEILPDGTIAVAGASNASVLAGQPALGENDVFLAWYTNEGQLLRARRYGGADEEYPTAFISRETNLFFARRVLSRVTAGTILVDLQRVSSTGEVDKTVELALPAQTEVAAFANNGSGICAAISMATYSSDAGAGSDFTVRCYSPELAELASTRRGTPGAQARAQSIACAPSGECTVVGFAETLFEGERIESITDAFVASFDSGLGFRGSKHFAPSIIDERTHAEATAVTYDSAGILIVGGDVGGSLFAPAIGAVDLFATALSLQPAPDP